MTTTPIGTVKVIIVEFLEDEVWEGSIPRECYENARVEEFEVDSVEDAIKVIRQEGLTFSAGSDWASHPDGTTIIDYATAQREERTAHIDSFSDADAAAIIEGVG